jgi:hypothetical protein
MKVSGCHTAWIGIQSGFEPLRRDILNRHETNKEIKDACDLLREAKIKIMIDHIFGLPYESYLSNDTSMLLYKDLKVDVVNCYELIYFPKARIIGHAIRAGILMPSDVAKINRGEGIVYNTQSTGSMMHDIYKKCFIAMPLNSTIHAASTFAEILPTILIKIIIHLRAGRGFIIRVIFQNEFFFAWRALKKKLGIM